MMRMLSPDLMDRRALAAIRLIDPAGGPLSSPARIEGEGMRFVAKTGGILVLLSAPGLEEHISSFAEPPEKPKIAKRYDIDILPADSNVMPRRAAIRLPRNPDPANAASLFVPIDIPMMAATTATIPATGAAVRVVVTQQGDGRRVGGALVRVASDNGQFKAQGMTNPAGEALVIVPHFPMSHVGGNAAVTDGLEGRVTVVADPATVLLTPEADALNARFDRLPDPDAIAGAFPDPGGGPAIRLSVRTPASVALNWKAP